MSIPTNCKTCLLACLWGGALRDDTKNGCVADYIDVRFNSSLLVFLHCFICLFPHSINCRIRIN